MFGKNGTITKFCENLPVVGYVAAAAHGIAGNHDEAKRAAAKCTNANLTVMGGVAGGLVAGPAGAVAGATAMKGVGIATEYGIGKNHIRSASVRAETKPTVKTAAIDLALTAAGGAAGKVGSAMVKEVTKTTVKEAGGYLSKAGLKQAGLEFAGAQAFKVPLVKVPGAIAKRK